MDTLSCCKIHKSYDGVCALIDVHLQFPSSGIIAIIGPNGAGKTTLLNILTGFLQPDTGSCFLGKREITRFPPYKIAQLGIARTFQDIHLIHQSSVLDNLLLARPNQGGENLLGALLKGRLEEKRNRDSAERLLQFAELTNHAADLAADLSYGQQKLLTLICCLATEARILFLDEPVAGVHPEMASRILNLLRQLRDQGKLVVFIEHDISVVQQVAEHVIVMDEGKVIVQGEPLEVLGRPEIMEAYLG